MINKWKKYFCSQKLPILVGFACTLLSYFRLATTTMIRMDTDIFSYSPETMLNLWLQVGRFGLVLFKHLLFLTAYHPVRSGICFILFLGLSMITAGYFLYDFSGEKDYPYWIFFLLYGTSHIWAYQVYFVLQEAEIGLVCWITSIAAGVMVKLCFQGGHKKWISLLVSVASLAALILSFGTYQSFILYYIALCLIYFVFLVYHSPERETSYWPGVLKLAAHFLVALVLYWLIANKLFLSNGQYLNSQMKWGNFPFTHCLWELKYELGSTLKWRDQAHFSYYPIGVVIGICSMFYLLFREKDRRLQSRLWIVAGLAGIMLIPFGMNIAMGGIVVNRIQFCLQISAAFLPLFGYAVFSKFWKKIGTVLLFLTCICITAFQIGINGRLYHTDSLRYQADCAYADQLSTALADFSHEEKPVILLGIHRFPDLEETPKSGDYGYSFFEWGNGIDPADSNAPGSCRFLKAYKNMDISREYTQEMLEEACSIGLGMNDFPDENSVLETPEYVIVRMSAYGE